VDTAASIPDLETALKNGHYRFLYVATEAVPRSDGAMVIETFTSKLAAQLRLEGLQSASYDTGSENPEVVLRPLGPEGEAETGWAFCVTPAFGRNRVPRLWDALVWCEGFEPFEPDARAFTDALIDQGAYLAAGWRVPVTDEVTVHVAADLLARL